MDNALNDETFAKLDQIEAEARQRGRALLQHALKGLLEKPAVVSLVMGVKRIDQLELLVKAIE